MPMPELADCLRLVRELALQCSDASVIMLRPVLFSLQLRDLRVRDSENVVTHGGYNLQRLAAAVPEEECKMTKTHTHTVHGCIACLRLYQHTLLSCAVWLIYEQVAIAALDTRAMELAISLIQKIRKKFPNSSRTYRLTVRHLTL